MFGKDKDGRPYIRRDRKVFIINGKTYKEEKETSKKKSDHSSKVFLKEVDMKEYDKRIEKIIDYLVSAFDEKKFLKSLLEGMPLSELDLIERRMAKKLKVKEKDGCYNLEIGDLEIPIHDE